MRIALIADVHSNIIALEAVIKAIKRHSPDMLLSLGDQVNLGPCPRETLALLKAEGAVCLHGNHERYILSAMAGDPGYAGANFAVLRYNAALLAPEEITFPREIQIEHVTFCHAMPGDDRFPVFDPALALPRLSAMEFKQPTHIICGHGHNPSHIRYGNVTIDSIGSAGCMDDGVPGTAPFAILTLEHGQAMLRPYYVSYDVRPMKEIFKKSGMAAFCPIMARIGCMQMTLNQDFIVPFVERAQSMSKARGESVISEPTWRDADAAFPWPDGVSTAEYWA